MSKKKEKSVLAEAGLPNAKSIDKINDTTSKLTEEILVSTSGVTDQDRKNTDVSHIRTTSNRLFVKGNRKLDTDGGITRVTGKDKVSGLELASLMETVMSNENVKLLRETPDIYSNEQITILTENDWMMANMQQLSVAFEQIIVSILAPDDFSKKSLKLSTTGGSEDANLTKSINDILVKELNIDKIVETALSESVRNGYSYIYHIPNSKLATDIYEKYKTKRGNSIRESNITHIGEMSEVLKFTDEYINEITLTPEVDIREVNGVIREIDNNVELLTSPVTNNALAHIENVLTEQIDSELIKEGAWDDNVLTGFKTGQMKVNTNRDKRLSELGVKSEDVTRKDVDNKFKKLTGVYVEHLDSRCITEARVGKTLLGIFEVTINKKDNLGGIETNGRDYTNNNERGVLNKIVKVLEGNIEPRFLRNNKHLLPNIKDILDKSTGELDKVTVRYIPAKYITKFTENCDSKGNPRSILQKARSPIYSWILANKAHLMNDLFYKRELIHVSANVDGDDDDLNETVINAVQELRELFPTPGELLQDINKSYSRMANGRVIMTFKDPQGDAPLTIDRMPGTDIPNDRDLLKSYEDNAFDIINSGVNMRRDADSNFAATVASKDGLAFRQAISRQANYQPQFTLLASKLFNMYDGQANKEKDDRVIEVTLNPPTNFVNALRSDKLRTLADKITFIVDAITGALGDDNNRDIIKDKLTLKLYEAETSDMIEWDDIKSLTEGIIGDITNTSSDKGDE